MDEKEQAITDEMLEKLYGFEAWELPHNEIDFTLKTVSGNEHFTLSKHEATNLVKRILDKYPHWKHGQQAEPRSMTE